MTLRELGCLCLKCALCDRNFGNYDKMAIHFFHIHDRLSLENVRQVRLLFRIMELVAKGKSEIAYNKIEKEIRLLSSQSAKTRAKASVRGNRAK